MAQHDQSDSRLNLASAALDYRFAFGGRMTEVFDRWVREDAKHWNLSWKFRCYYQLRRWIPTTLRQCLQKRRNCRLPVGESWYYHHEFAEDFTQSVREECSQPQRMVVHPWPDAYEHATVLTHDIESSAGLKQVDKLAQLEEQYGFRSAWYFVPASYPIDAGMLSDLQARGHEVAVHGYNHDGRLFSTPEVFHSRASKINDVLHRWQVTGFRAPMMHRQLSWMQALEVDYDASCFDIDPFQAMPGGIGGVWPFIAGRFVELPCTLPQDHTLFVTLQQRSTDIWRKKHALLKRLHGMAMCLVHPDYLDTPGRWDLYRQLLDQFAAEEQAWKCLPREVSSWWRLRTASAVEGNSVDSYSVIGPACQRGRAVDLRVLFAELLA